MSDKFYFNLPSIPSIVNNSSSDTNVGKNDIPNGYTPQLPPITSNTLQQGPSSSIPPKRRGRPPKNSQINDTKKTVSSINANSPNLLDIGQFQGTNPPISSTPVLLTTHSSSILPSISSTRPTSSFEPSSIRSIQSANVPQSHSISYKSIDSHPHDYKQHNPNPNANSSNGSVPNSSRLHSPQFARMLTNPQNGDSNDKNIHAQNKSDSYSAAKDSFTQHSATPVPTTVPSPNPNRISIAPPPLSSAPPKRKRGRPRTRDIKERTSNVSVPSISSLAMHTSAGDELPGINENTKSNDSLSQNQNTPDQVQDFRQQQSSSVANPNDIIIIQPAIIVTPSGVSSLKGKGTKERRKRSKKETVRKDGEPSSEGIYQLVSSQTIPEQPISKRIKKDPVDYKRADVLGISYPTGSAKPETANTTGVNSNKLPSFNDTLAKNSTNYLNNIPIIQHGDQNLDSGQEPTKPKATTRISVQQLLAQVPDSAATSAAVLQKPATSGKKSDDSTKTGKTKLSMGIARMLAGSEDHRVTTLSSAIPVPLKRSSSITSFVNDANAPLGATRSFTQPQPPNSLHHRPLSFHIRHSNPASCSVSESSSPRLHTATLFQGHRISQVNNSNNLAGNPSPESKPSIIPAVSFIQLVPSQGQSLVMNPQSSSLSVSSMSSSASSSVSSSISASSSLSTNLDESVTPVVDFQNYQVPPSPSLFPPIPSSGNGNLNGRINGIGSSDVNGIKTGKEDGYYVFPSARSGYMNGRRDGNGVGEETEDQSTRTQPVQEFKGFPGFNGFNGQGLPHEVSLRSFSAASGFYVTQPSLQSVDNVDTAPDSLPEKKDTVQRPCSSKQATPTTPVSKKSGESQMGRISVNQLLG